MLTEPLTAPPAAAPAGPSAGRARTGRPRAGRRRAALLAVLVASSLGLAACGGLSSSGTSSGAADSSADGDSVGGGSAYESPGDRSGVANGDAVAPDASVAASGSGQEADKASGAPLLAADPARARRIRTAEMTLTVKVLETAAAQVRSAADGLGGYISSEVTGVTSSASLTSTDGSTTASVKPGEAVIVARIPEADLDTAIEKISTVGKEVSRSQTDQDVTGEIADVTSRIETQKQSVARTRELLAKASTIQDIVFIENELTKREADLEALQARLTSLSNRADYSTLTVTLQVPEVAAQEPVPSTGFVAGLRQGWEALVASTNVVLTVLGTVLPVAVVLLVVGYPASVLLRRRSKRLADERAAAYTAQAQHQPMPFRQPAMAGAPAQAPAPASAPTTGPDAGGDPSAPSGS